MSERITYDWIEERIKQVIDQHFQESKWISDKQWLKTMQLHYIGGILQTALFLLPNDRYYKVKKYVWEKYGYDPGGAKDDQISIFEMMEE